MPQQVQQEADDAKASLGVANSLLEQIMPKQEATGEEQSEIAPESPEMAPEQTEPQPVEETIEEPKEEKQELTTKDLDEFKGDIEGVIDTKFKELTKTLENALESE